jgi:GAF domain-containing protein
MLCHAMDWLLRQLGYSNVAIWLTGDDGQYQLGAYMKYTTAGEPALTEAIKSGVLRTLHHDGFLHHSAEEAREKLSPAEKTFLANQNLIGTTCTYLGEALAAVMLFRDAGTPFTDDDAEALKTIAPLFATALAAVVHDEETGGGDDDDDGSDDRDTGGSMLDDDVQGGDGKRRKKQQQPKSDADWWKRGEAPPF